MLQQRLCEAEVPHPGEVSQKEFPLPLQRDLFLMEISGVLV